MVHFFWTLLGSTFDVSRMKTLRLTEQQYADRTKKASKYRNVKTDGFASKKEAKRYQELLLLEKAGEIRDLRTQTRLPIVVNGIKVCDYFCDFSYTEGSHIVFEDTKGMKTPIYSLKKKLVKAVHNIVIKET